MTTSTRLKTCLYSFTSPGGPMYPTRVVRHAAWDALDFLFPVSIFLINLAQWPMLLIQINSLSCFVDIDIKGLVHFHQLATCPYYCIRKCYMSNLVNVICRCDLLTCFLSLIGNRISSCAIQSFVFCWKLFIAWYWCFVQVGRYPRHLISLFFRLLYPWYWPSSCWNFIMSCIQAVLYSILSFIFFSFRKNNKS